MRTRALDAARQRRQRARNREDLFILKIPFPHRGMNRLVDKMVDTHILAEADSKNDERIAAAIAAYLLQK